MFFWISNKKSWLQYVECGVSIFVLNGSFITRDDFASSPVFSQTIHNGNKDSLLGYPMAARDNYPIISNEEGIKLKTEDMVTDQLYHIIYEGKVFLFYKDEESLLHCYEVENPDAIREIAENPMQLEHILKKYANQIS